MTALRLGRTRGQLVGMRRGGALMAVLALAGLATLGLPGAARGASPTDSYNQMTGEGTAASSLTVDWTKGLLNAQNQAITAPGNELSPNSDRSSSNPMSVLKFMYDDFKNLQVTVSQTQNIGHQGITVKWTGGVSSRVGITPQADFLQMMECYGDPTTGLPSPEDCEYGSTGMLGAQAVNPGIGDRGGNLCSPGSTPSTDPSKTPTGPQAPDPAYGCDTKEPGSDTPPHCDPQAPPGTSCNDGIFYIPFRPIDDPSHPIYEQQNLPADFSEFNSNEVQAATTGTDGTGQQQFQTLTNVQAPHLGCGQVDSNGHAQGCWLVIVPRGQYETNGYKVQGIQPLGGFLRSSPLSASNWAQRIQIHLDYTPLSTACPLNVLPTQSVGTQVISRAVSSWQFALNEAAKCSRIYIYTASTEGESTDQLTGGGAGLAFTTIPIGSENTRIPGGQVPKLPKILYAPVAVTALGFGFNVNEGNGYLTTPVKLTPRLLAKGLTQVYRFDLPDVVAHDPAHQGPKWAASNPNNITQDSEFKRLNPDVVPYVLASIPLAPLVTVEHSALAQQVWQWVQSDRATSSWLGGTPDKSDPVAADPDYVALHLGKSPATDSFPHAYNGELVLEPPFCVNPPSCTQTKDRKLSTADMLPFADNMDSAAANVVGAVDNALTNNWDPTAQAPDHTSGWWDKVGVQAQGQTFMWAASDLPDLAAYGVIAAQFCAPSGGNCVVPSVASVTKALGSATADNTGLLHVNPAKVPAGGYPLVDVVYAAVPTNQSAAALTDYADLIQYAASKGQLTGSAPGELPPGYLPLPASLKAKAQAVVTQLRNIAHPPNPTPGGTQSSGSGSGSTTGSNSSGTGTTSGSGTTSNFVSGGTATSANRAVASGSPSPQGPVYVPPSAQLAGGTTPRSDVGTVRWVLITVIIIGGAGVLFGTLLRSGRLPRWRRGART